MAQQRSDEQPSSSFDEALRQLEELAGKLESGDIPLEDALQVYEQAVGLFRQCRQRLGGVEQRLEKLTRDLDEEPAVTPITADVDDALDG